MSAKTNKGPRVTLESFITEVEKHSLVDQSEMVFNLWLHETGGCRVYHEGYCVELRGKRETALAPSLPELKELLEDGKLCPVCRDRLTVLNRNGGWYSTESFLGVLERLSAVAELRAMPVNVNDLEDSAKVYSKGKKFLRESQLRQKSLAAFALEAAEALELFWERVLRTAKSAAGMQTLKALAAERAVPAASTGRMYAGSKIAVGKQLLKPHELKLRSLRDQQVKDLSESDVYVLAKRSGTLHWECPDLALVCVGACSYVKGLMCMPLALFFFIELNFESYENEEVLFLEKEPSQEVLEACAVLARKDNDSEGLSLEDALKAAQAV